MTNIEMTFGEYSFSPVPMISLSYVTNRSEDGTYLGKTCRMTLNGTLCEVGETDNIVNLDRLKDELTTALSVNTAEFIVICLENADTLIHTYPRVLSFNFAESTNNWTATIPYTIEMEFNVEVDEFVDYNISSSTDEWSIEFVEDSSRYSWSLPDTDKNPFQLRVTHNVSAVGITRSDEEEGAPAWENAREWVSNQLGWDSTKIIQSGVLNLQSSLFAPYNHMRAVQQDEAGGKYSVSETWLVVSTEETGNTGKAIESFTVSVRKANSSDISTVSIEGNIVGLEERNYQGHTNYFNVTTTKDTNALSYWNTVKSRLYNRAVHAASGLLSRTLNVVEINNSFGRSPSTGTITYSIEYDDRPSNCITGSLTESISITDTDALDVFASIVIPGRANGPVLQDMNTVTSRTRQISIDVVMPPLSICPSNATNVGLIFSGSPKAEVDSIINNFYTELANQYSQVFKHDGNENWDFKSGRYTRQVGWTFQNCSI